MQDKQIDPELIRLCESQGYRIESCIGQGTFGVVYKASNSNKQPYALKCMNLHGLISCESNAKKKQLKLQFLQSEYQVMMKCKASNFIIKCMSKFQSEKWMVLVLQYCDGGTLSEDIQRQSFEQQKAITYLEQIVRGFATIHREKIIHRDLKTENILIHQGNIKIADFGLAKSVKSLTERRDEASVGSRLTSAPEVISGQKYDSQADIWSLGIIYYEMLTGRYPFKENVTEDDVVKFRKTLNSLSISPESKSFLEKLLVINPDERMKWKDLYKMMSDRTGVFKIFSPDSLGPLSQTKPPNPSNTSPPPDNQSLKPSPLPYKPQSTPVQRDSKQTLPPPQPHGRTKGIKMISAQTVPAEQPPISDDRFVKLIDDLQRIKMICDKVITPISTLKSRHFHNSINNQLEQVVNNFYLMICSQLKVIIEENSINNGVGIPQMHKKEYEELSRYQQTVERQQASSNDRLHEIQRSYSEGVSIKIPMLKEEVEEVEEVKGTEDQYLQYTCPQDAHINKTIEIYQKALRISEADKNNPVFACLKNIQHFMTVEYRNLVAERKR